MVRWPIPLSAVLHWGPYDTPRGWLRGLLISVAGALFLGFGGAFGSSQTPVAARLVYWLVLMLLGWLWGALVSRQIFRRAPSSLNVWQRGLLAALALSVPFSVVVALAGMWAFHDTYAPGDIPKLLGSVTLISGVMIAINILAERQMATSGSETPPKFLDRLPLRLRGAEVWAVEAEDHYLRLHTSKGQDLILMRLADAVVELQGIEGAQVHRSWWVARDAITDAERGDGRAVLTLKDGAQVPVSRTYARTLRANGWI